jgi:SAM-dependent methyltransferase
MLKMHHSGAHEGGSPDLWEENWEHNDFETALRFCETDPLLPLFERYARPGTTMLEGGCGHGHYVAYYSSRGVNVVGLDFAQQTLGRLHTRVPGLMLCAGDVSALPFSDATFDLYYSGGVVEHFEGGPERAIEEARRVLRPGGVLLISVPYLSLLRSAMSPFKSSFWKRVSRASVDGDGAGPEFFQYIYLRQEFEAILARAGLHIVSTQGYGILWGLYDVPFLQTVIERLTGSPLATNVSSTQPTGANPNEPEGALSQPAGSLRASSLRAIIKRLIVSEDDSVPIAGLGVRLMRRVCANMMMYVCVRTEDSRLI